MHGVTASCHVTKMAPVTGSRSLMSHVDRRVVSATMREAFPDLTGRARRRSNRPIILPYSSDVDRAWVTVGPILPPMDRVNKRDFAPLRLLLLNGGRSARAI